MKKGLILIPAFNEEKTIGQVLKKIPRRVLGLPVEVLVVDDGSSDQTELEAIKYNSHVLSHPINRGLGAALGTGFVYAKESDYDFLVTLDADGQHDPTEIPKLVKPILLNQADFVVGTRVLKKGMPIYRKVLTFFASMITLLFTGIWTTDSQSGFRAFSKEAIEKINIEVDRMEVSSDLFNQSREKRLKIIEVPIKPIYTQYSNTKGQNFLNSFNIIGKLILQKVR